jgi:glycosyltransferase involved in cell wall biosynthesis
MENKIRILDIITTAQGGKRLLEYRVSEINKDRRFINYLACPRDDFFTRSFSGAGIRFIPFPMSRGLNPAAAIGEIIRFVKLLKKTPVDVLHAHTSKAGAVSRIGAALYNLGKKKRVYVVYQVHSFFFNALRGIKKNIFLYLEIFLSRLSDSILFQNQLELEQGKEFGMDKRALLINIGNGINLGELAALRRIRGLPEGIVKSGGTYAVKEPFVIICVARVEAKKNHAMLINGVKKLRDALAAVYGQEAAALALKVYCVGEIGDPETVRFAGEQGLGAAIEFTGVKDRKEIAPLLEKSSLSVLTSVAEGKPRALMEAMSIGIPCVATDVCGTRDVVDHGKTGLLVPLNDTEAFSAAILRLMNDPELYKKFSRNSIEKAKAEFDENRVVETLKIIYSEKPG